MFSKSGVSSIEVYIDGTFEGQAKQAKGPLYTLPWNPKSFSAGLHTLRIRVKVSQCPNVVVIITLMNNCCKTTEETTKYYLYGK